MVIEESLLMDKTNLRLLTQINYPEDLRKLSVEELPEVCRELREDIIQEVSVNPGHFASSLGAIGLVTHIPYKFVARRVKHIM